MNTLRAILMLDQSGAKLTDEFGNATGAAIELLFGSAIRLELDLRSSTQNSDGQLTSYPIANFSGTAENYFALNDTFSSTSGPKYLQFEDVGIETVQGKTIFHAVLPALNSATLGSALAGQESVPFFCECGGVDNGTPPTVIYCFQFQLTIRNRIYPGAGSAVIAGNPAYYTALETEAAIGRTISGGTDQAIFNPKTYSGGTQNSCTASIVSNGAVLQIPISGSALQLQLNSSAVSSGTVARFTLLLNAAGAATVSFPDSWIWQNEPPTIQSAGLYPLELFCSSGVVLARNFIDNRPNTGAGTETMSAAFVSRFENDETIISAVEEEAAMLSGAVFVSGGTVTSAAMLSGSVETLSGWVEMDDGDRAHFYDCAPSEQGFTIYDGAVVNSAGDDESTFTVSGGIVKYMELDAWGTEETGDGGVCYQYGGIVSKADIENSGEEEGTPAAGHYTISGGTLGAVNVWGSLIVCSRGVVGSTMIGNGGTVTVSSGAVLSNVTLNGGTLAVLAGGTAYDVHYISGTWTSNGSAVSGYDDPILGRRRSVDPGLATLSGAVQSCTDVIYNDVIGNSALDARVSAFSGAIATMRPITAVSGGTVVVSPGDLKTWNAAAYNNATMSAAGTAGYYGEAKVQVFTGSNTVTFSGISIQDPLLTNAVNFCELHFIGTQVNLHVNSELYGYVVTVTGGTASGSLHYAVNSSTSAYISFSGDHAAYDLEGGTISRDVELFGNGAERTSICAVGGTLTEPDGGLNLICDGLTLAPISGGTGTRTADKRFIFRNCTLGGVHTYHPMTLSNCVVEGGYVSAGNGSFVTAGDAYELNGVLVQNCNSGGFQIYSGYDHTVSNLTVSGCTAAEAVSVYWNGAGTFENVHVRNCVTSGKGAMFAAVPCNAKDITIDGGTYKCGLWLQGAGARWEGVRITNCTFTLGHLRIVTGNHTFVNPYFAGKGESYVAPSHSLTLSGGTFYNSNTDLTNSGTLSMCGSCVINGKITNANGATCNVTGATIDFTGGTTGIISGGSILVDDGYNVNVRYMNGGTATTTSLTGSGTFIKWDGTSDITED